MLNRDQDRERAALFLALRDKSTHRNGANSHVLSSLVWFREPPPPRPYSSFESRHPGFFSYAGESASPFYINYYLNFLRSLYKTE